MNEHTRQIGTAGNLQARPAGMDPTPWMTPYNPIDNDGPGLFDYARMILARWKLALVVSLAILVCGMLVYRWPAPMFRSTATIEIDNEHRGFTDKWGPSSFNWDFGRYLSNQMAILQSRSMAENLVEDMELEERLYNQPVTNSEPGLISRIWSKTVSLPTTLLTYVNPPPPAPAPEEPKKARDAQHLKMFANDVLGRISVHRAQDEGSILEVGMIAETPELAQEMLQSYLRLYLDRHTAQRREDGERFTAWLGEELRRTEEKLLESEKELVDFLNQNKIFFADEDGLDQFRDKMTRTMNGLVDSKKTKSRLKSLYEGTTDIHPRYLDRSLENQYLAELKQELARLEAEEADMRAIYSADYPKRALLTRKIEVLRQRIFDMERSALASALDSAKEEEKLMEQEVRDTRNQALRRNALSVRYALLKKNTEIHREIHKIVLQEYKQAAIKARSVANNIRMVDPPSFPTNPLPNGTHFYIFAILVLSFVGGAGTAFFAATRDDGSEAIKAVETHHRVRKLGMVPDISKLRREHGIKGSGKSYEFLVHEDPRSPMAHAIRGVHASLMLSEALTDRKCIAVSSVYPGEGKTLLSTSLATILTSHAGSRVLLVDCDWERSRLHKLFGRPHDAPGLTDLICDPSTDVESVIRPTEIPGLFYILSGPTVQNSTSLYTSDRLRKTLDELRDRFDFVILDNPPILACPESQILSRYADGLIMVALRKNVGSEDFGSVMTSLTSMPANPVLGVVINKAEPNFGGYYYPYYGYSRKYRRKA